MTGHGTRVRHSKFVTVCGPPSAGSANCVNPAFAPSLNTVSRTPGFRHITANLRQNPLCGGGPLPFIVPKMGKRNLSFQLPRRSLG